MTRFLIDNDIQSSSDIENFNSSGYTFNQAETADSSSPVLRLLLHPMIHKNFLILKKSNLRDLII